MLGSHAGLEHRRRGSFGVRAPTPAPGVVMVGVEALGVGQEEPSATELLLRAGSGDTRAVESMFPLVYDENWLIAYHYRIMTLGALMQARTVYVLDKHKKVRWVDRGAPTTAELKEILQAINEGKQPPLPPKRK